MVKLSDGRVFRWADGWSAVCEMRRRFGLKNSQDNKDNKFPTRQIPEPLRQQKSCVLNEDFKRKVYVSIFET